jgi:hypothetical protein
MKRSSLLSVLAALVLGASALATTAAAAPTPALSTSAVTQNVTGTLADGTGNVVGQVTVTGFQVVNGVVNAVATFTGSVTDAAGTTVTGTQQILIPLAQATGSCTILHLELGPLDLNLLGLMVHLDRVVLDITAQSGPGNLLGNLLCAVAHLLDSSSSATAVSNLLNQILRA